jgi:L-fuconate dehydratase
MGRVVGLDTHDIRFPTSRWADGSDAMNPRPDYAAAYVVVRTDLDDGLNGHGFAFTIGRGNDVELAAIRALEPFVLGADVEEVLGDLGRFARMLVGDSPLRWLGPEKGVMHMAIGALVNALFDLRAKREGKPLWRLLADLGPEELVSLVDFRYLSEVLDRDEAIDILATRAGGKEERTLRLEKEGYPAYTTSAGWLGYSDERLVRLCEEAVDAGFGLVKLKVGASLEEDLRRCRIVRDAVGPDIGLAVDANQVWDVDDAISWVHRLEGFDIAWVEEPTSPDDVLGLAAIRRGISPTPVAAGEHVPNRVVFKQLLQAGALDIMQIDACRVGGVSENIANLLLAAKFGIPVIPHAGGVGLCELVQHLAMFDYVALGNGTGLAEGGEGARLIEWIDHLHEHFVDPARVAGGRYMIPGSPGASTEMRLDSIAEYRFPDGPAWLGDLVTSRSSVP